jgi:GH24 family phage-related lysozyme (muramidase)
VSDFFLWRTLRSPDPTRIMQVVAVDQSTGDLYTSTAVPRDATVEDIWIDHFVGDVSVGRMTLTGGTDHAYLFTVDNAQIVTQVNFKRVAFGFVAGSTLTASDALKNPVPYTPVYPTPSSWCQGEVTEHGVTYRLFGVPYKADGPSLNPDGTTKPKLPAQVQVIVNNQVTKVIDCAMLGRDGMKLDGAPIGGRLEPEGLSLATINDKRFLIIGVTTGALSEDQTHYLYARALPVLLDTTPMKASVRAAWPAFAKTFEGRVPTMYLDTKGLVTTGTGNLIDSIHDAQSLPWLTKDDKRATPAQIEAEWRQMKARQSSKSLGGFAFVKWATLHLDETAINTLLLDKTDEFWDRLAQSLPSLSTYPADAQLALLDLAWQNGPAFLDSKKDGKYVWAGTRAAVLAQDWKAAAGHVPGTGARADRRKRLYTNAATVKAKGLDYEVLWDTRTPVAPTSTATTPATPKPAAPKPAAPKPKPTTKVSLKALVKAAKNDPTRRSGATTKGSVTAVKVVQTALVSEGALKGKAYVDGSWGPVTVKAWAAYMKKNGWPERDNLPDRQGLVPLGTKHGFEVIA